MARTITRKRYPIGWFLGAAAVVVLVGLFVAGVFSGLDDRTTYAVNVPVLVGFMVAAAIVAFLPLAFPKREVIEVKLPSDHLHEASRTELQGILEQLDASRAKGEITEERYQNARKRIVAEMGGKKA